VVFNNIIQVITIMLRKTNQNGTSP